MGYLCVRTAPRGLSFSPWDNVLNPRRAPSSRLRRWPGHPFLLALGAAGSKPGRGRARPVGLGGALDSEKGGWGQSTWGHRDLRVYAVFFFKYSENKIIEFCPGFGVAL